MRTLFLLLFLLPSYLAAEPLQKNGNHITYLIKTHKYETAIELYQKQKKERHDFELLEQMAQIILEQGAKSSNPEEQLISIAAAASVGMVPQTEILLSGITSSNPHVALATIRLLSQVQDDKCEQLLSRAMASPFLPIRMEAAYQMAIRKHRAISGHIEALMNRLPPPFRVYFPEFFALIGSTDAISTLKRMIDDPIRDVRIEALLASARFGRDDLLPVIRRHAAVGLELETCAYALGALKDSSSAPLLRALTENADASVQLAAIKALSLLGDSSYLPKVSALAKSGNLFAINLLGENLNAPGSEEILLSLSSSKNPSERLDALIALLNRKDARCLPGLYDFLLEDSSNLAIYPSFSSGRSLLMWKIAPSARQLEKKTGYAYEGQSWSVREQLLRQCRDLPEDAFLEVAEKVFAKNQVQLIPTTVLLLEKMRTEKTRELLKANANRVGAPLIRNYCTLALFRMKEPGNYREILLRFVQDNKKQELFQFKPPVARNPLIPSAQFELQPEESSRLLLETYEALSETHDEKVLDLLLEVFKEGSEINRCLLAGALLKTLQ